MFVRGIMHVNVEPVWHVKHDQSEPSIGSRQLLYLAICQHDHLVPRQIIRVATDLRQDLRCNDVAGDDPWRVEKTCVDHGAKLWALIALVILADDDPRREDRLI